MSHEAWQARFRCQWLKWTRWIPPGPSTPGYDRHPGLLRLYLCKPRGREGAGSSIGNIQTRKYATLRTASTVDTSTWCGGFIPGSLAAYIGAVIGVLPSSCRARLFDNGSVRRQRSGPSVCCTHCVFGCGARRVCADAGVLCLYPRPCCKVSHCCKSGFASLLCSPYLP